jgi:hypothetical protein
VNQAGVYICVSCRDNPDDACGDYCEMEQLRELLPLGLIDGYPACDCCGKTMHLLRPLVELVT